MDPVIIPKELQISVYHEGVLLLLGYSSYKNVIEKIAEAKKSGTLVEQITTYSEEKLRDIYKVKAISVQNTGAWNLFLRELRVKSRQYEEMHQLVLASVIRLMNDLNWQDRIDLRKLLTLFLHTEQEFAHFRLAIAGTNYSGLEQWRDSIIEESKQYAAYQSKQISF